MNRKQLYQRVIDLCRVLDFDREEDFGGDYGFLVEFPKTPISLGNMEVDEIESYDVDGFVVRGNGEHMLCGDLTDKQLKILIDGLQNPTLARNLPID